jgi:serine phosphatase RsbU (regulator of sigma subunit)
MSPRPPRPKVPEPPPRHFLRAFRLALFSERTYDVRKNPTVWLGFVAALPIPVFAVAGDAPPLVLIPSLLAPIFWAAILGAAGRVGLVAQREQRRLENEVRRQKQETATLDRALDEEVHRRMALEEKEQEALRELRLAAAVHRTLIPANVNRRDLEVAVQHIPTAFVGGDYLHATVVADRWAYLAVGDVAGHGVAAALVVARIHGLFRRLTLEQRARPEALLERMNQAAMTLFQHTYFFMTLAIFRLDLKTGVVEYATAGHPAQVLLRCDGTLERLRTPNRLLGMDADIFDDRHPSAMTRLDPGDALVLFSDGLFEIMDPTDGEILGEDGLHERIRSVRGLSPSLMAGEILQDLADFQGSSAFEDDVSLMVALYHGRRGQAT